MSSVKNNKENLANVNNSINNSRQNSGSSSSTGIKFQVILMFITLAITAHLLHDSLRDFTSNDLMPVIRPIDKNIKSLPQPSSWVKVGLFISGFSRFDTLNDDFILDGVLSFEFDPTILKLEDISKFSFRNGDIISKSKPQIKLNNKLMFANYTIRVKIKSGLDYKLFPFTDHRLNIIIENNFLSLEQTVFKALFSKFIVNHYINISGWKEYNKTVLSGYHITQFQLFEPDAIIKHPRVGFIIGYLNNSAKEISSILLPLFLLFFMSIFAFGLNDITYFHQIAGLTSGSLTGLLSYRYVINNISPKVEYFMASDIIYFVFLTLIIFIFLASCQTYELNRKHKMLISILSHLIVISTFVYIIKIWPYSHSLHQS